MKKIFFDQITTRKAEGGYNQRKSPRQNMEIRKFYIYPIFVVIGSWIVVGFKCRQTQVICVWLYLNRPL
jgi:hypothetical protein